MSDLDFTNDKVQGQLDDGTYTVRIKAAELKDSKSGGVYINAEFAVFDKDAVVATEQLGTVFHMFNIKNANAKAEQIGRGQLKQILEICEQPTKLEDVSALCGLTLHASVKNKLDDYTGTMKPRISGFKK